MGAIVVAIMIGLVAVGLVVAVIMFATVAIAGLKAVNLAHDSGTWFANRMHARRAR